MELIVVDTETSDLDPDKGAKLLEVAWIKVVHNGQVWTTCDPEEYYILQSQPTVISPHAQAQHHIRLDMLTAENGAIKRYDVVCRLIKCMQENSILVAHNAQFDSKFFPEITRPWICTYRSARHIWPGAPGHSNQVLRYWLDLKLDLPLGRHPHQALYDVITTAGILLRMLEKHTPDQLLSFSTSPVKLRNIGFGKHRGMSFDDIPRDYLLWLRGQPNLDNDLRHTIDSILNK